MANIPRRNTTLTYWKSNRERVNKLNGRAGDAMKKKLARIPLLEEQICISAIGSDGRLEKGLDSKLEVQLLHRGLSESATREIDMMVREIQLNEQPLLNGSETEVKELGSDPMVYAYSNRSVAAPARVLDSVVLFGDPSIAADAKAELVGELLGKQGRRVLEKLKERKRTFKGVTETGAQVWKGLRYNHFDLERGVTYFDDVADGTGGASRGRIEKRLEGF